MPVNIGNRPAKKLDGKSGKTGEILSNVKGDDGMKYQYAVQLATRDLDGDTSDTDKFRNLVDDYYDQMTPERSGAEMRGESMFSQAVRGVGETMDNVNDVLGNGIDQAWDFIAGNAAGAVGGLLGAFTGNEDLGDDFNKNVSDLVTPESADAIADFGTGLAIASIPGIGIPLSVGIGLARNSDELAESLTGRDAVTLEKLDEDERAGRAITGILDSVMSVAPAAIKTGKMMKGVGIADDIKALKAKNPGKTLKDIAGNLDVSHDKPRIIKDVRSAMKGSGPSKNFDEFAGKASDVATAVKDGATRMTDDVKNAMGMFDRRDKADAYVRLHDRYAKPTPASPVKSGDGKVKKAAKNIARKASDSDRAKSTVMNLAPFVISAFGNGGNLNPSILSTMLIEGSMAKRGLGKNGLGRLIGKPQGVNTSKLRSLISQDRSDNEDTMDDDEILNRIKMMNGAGNGDN